MRIQSTTADDDADLSSVKDMFERKNAIQVKYPPDMDDRADKADDYWAARLGFPAGDKPLADAYSMT